MTNSPQTPAGQGARTASTPGSAASTKPRTTSSTSAKSKPKPKAQAKPAAKAKPKSGKAKTAAKRGARSGSKPKASPKKTTSTRKASPGAKRTSTTTAKTRKPATTASRNAAGKPTRSGKVLAAAGRVGSGPRRVGEIVFERVNELVEAGSTAKDAFPVVARELRMTTANVQQHYYRFQRRVRSQAQETADRAGASVSEAFDRLGSLAVSGGEVTARFSRKAADALAAAVPDALPPDVAKGIRRAGDLGENAARIAAYTAGSVLKSLPEPRKARRVVTESARMAGSAAAGAGKAVRRRVKA